MSNPTKETMAVINEVNDLLYQCREKLKNQSQRAVDMREKIDIEETQKNISVAIRGILKTFFPEKEFDAGEALKKKTKFDVELREKANEILDDHVKKLEESKLSQVEVNKLWKRLPDKCVDGCNGCDSREVVGDEEHCLQGNEMK